VVELERRRTLALLLAFELRKLASFETLFEKMVKTKGDFMRFSNFQWCYKI